MLCPSGFVFWVITGLMTDTSGTSQVLPQQGESFSCQFGVGPQTPILESLTRTLAYIPIANYIEYMTNTYKEYEDQTRRT